MSRVVVAIALAAWAVPACAPVAQPPSGVLGERREVVFQGENDVVLAATTRLSTGSAFDVKAVPRTDADLGGATFESDDEGVLKVVEPDVAGGRVEVVAPGAAYLQVRGESGAVIDRVAVRAAAPLRTELVEQQLLGAVDARLPALFGLVVDEDVELLVAAIDRCGGDLLDQGASTMTTSDAAIVDVTATETGGFLLTPLAAGDAVITLTSTDLPEQAYEVRVVTVDLVDDVAPTAASASENNVLLWGRAYAGSTEVVGLTYAWGGTDRVKLSLDRGAWTTATIEGVNGDGADGGAVVEGDAKVTAEAAGEEDELDLLALTAADLVSTRVGQRADDPVPGDPAPTGGCAGGTAPQVCDPTAAVALVGMSALRRLSRRRSGRAG